MHKTTKTLQQLCQTCLVQKSTDDCNETCNKQQIFTACSQTCNTRVNEGERKGLEVLISSKSDTSVVTHERPLGRSQSDKSASKVHSREPGGALERAASEKLPAKLRCCEEVRRCKHQPQRETHADSGHVEKRVTIEPVSAGDMSIFLMNKHSTYLILHRNDVFFR